MSSSPEVLRLELERAGPYSFATRASAAAVHGLDAFDDWPGPPDIAVAYCRHARPGVRRIRSLSPGSVVKVGAWRVASGCLALAELGAVADIDRVERAVEAALRKGLVTESELRDPSTTRYRRGGAVLRDVLDRRRVGVAATESDAETLFVQLCRRGRVPDPERQLPQLLGQRYRLDFAWPELRLAVEVDGRVAHGWDRRGEDLRRQNRVVLAGWTLLRFTWDDIVRYPDQTLETLRLALAGRRAR